MSKLLDNLGKESIFSDLDEGDDFSELQNQLTEYNQICSRQKQAIDYAKDQYTKACMGEESAGQTEFEMTIDAILKGEDPKEYIKKANEVFLK